MAHERTRAGDISWRTFWTAVAIAARRRFARSIWLTDKKFGDTSSYPGTPNRSALFAAELSKESGVARCFPMHSKNAAVVGLG